MLLKYKVIQIYNSQINEQFRGSKRLYAHTRTHARQPTPPTHTYTAFRYSLPVLKIYSARHVYYRFAVLAMNIGTQP